MTTKTLKSESKLEDFTASFLLSEFRTDIRNLHGEFRKDIRNMHDEFRRDVCELKSDMSLMASNFNTKIDNNFKWILSIVIPSFFVTILTVIGTGIGLFLK